MARPPESVDSGPHRPLFRRLRRYIGSTRPPVQSLSIDGSTAEKPLVLAFPDDSSVTHTKHFAVTELTVDDNCDLDILYAQPLLQITRSWSLCQLVDLVCPRYAPLDTLKNCRFDYQALASLYNLPLEFSLERSHGVTHSFRGLTEDDGVESEHCCKRAGTCLVDSS